MNINLTMKLHVPASGEVHYLLMKEECTHVHAFPKDAFTFGK